MSLPPSLYPTLRLKYLCEGQPEYGINESATSYASAGVRFIRTTDVTELGELTPADEGVYLPREMVHEAILRDGDLLLSRSGTIGRSLLHDSVSHGECSFAGYLVRFRPDRRRVIPKFLFHFTKSRYFLDQIGQAAIQTTIENFNAQRYANLFVPLPEIRVQQAVADFLDRKTAAIDALIAKKERLIELIVEKRQALISEAVTQGLDRAADRDGGLFGPIPSHWRLIKLKHVVRTISGATPSKDDPAYWNGYVPWVSPKDMKSHLINETQDHVSERAVIDTGLKILEAPVVLVVVRGMILAHTLPVGLTTVPVTLNQDMKALIPQQGISPNYLVYLLKGVGELFLSIVEESGHGTKKLRTDLWGAVELPFPPFKEQIAIGDYLDRETASLDLFAYKVRSSVDLLGEYRRSLVTAAVTGQLYVRGDSLEAA